MYQERSKIMRYRLDDEDDEISSARGRFITTDFNTKTLPPNGQSYEVKGTSRRHSPVCGVPQGFALMPPYREVENTPKLPEDSTSSWTDVSDLTGPVVPKRSHRNAPRPCRESQRKPRSTDASVQTPESEEPPTVVRSIHTQTSNRNLLPFYKRWFYFFAPQVDDNSESTDGGVDETPPLQPPPALVTSRWRRLMANFPDIYKIGSTVLMIITVYWLFKKISGLDIVDMKDIVVGWFKEAVLVGEKEGEEEKKEEEPMSMLDMLLLKNLWASF